MSRSYRQIVERNGFRRGTQVVCVDPEDTDIPVGARGVVLRVLEQYDGGGPYNVTAAFLWGPPDDTDAEAIRDLSIDAVIVDPEPDAPYDMSDEDDEIDEDSP